MTGPRIYVIDDQASVRDALGEMLSVFGFDVEKFASAEAYLAAPAPQNGGCVVADVRMPGIDGIQLVQELSRRHTRLPIILISGHADVPMAVAAIKSGADDFIEKPVDDKELVAAINRGIARAAENHRAGKSADDLNERFARLTPRQVEIMDLVAEGCTSQVIAGKLKISVRTVESYRAEIMDKMQAESVAVLVRQAVRLGRVTL
jgi:two-component system, LuxR family, response regulator FixJ